MVPERKREESDQPGASGIDLSGEELAALDKALADADRAVRRRQLISVAELLAQIRRVR
jgi:hypothetical protein